jgi:hypothetical protein
MYYLTEAKTEAIAKENLEKAKIAVNESLFNE